MGCRLAELIVATDSACGLRQTEDATGVAELEDKLQSLPPIVGDGDDHTLLDGLLN